MNQAEYKDDEDEVGHLHTHVLLEAVQIVEALVANRQRDNRVHQEIVGTYAQERRPDQCDTMPQRERGDVFQDVSELRKKEDDTEQKQEVIVPRQHVRRTERKEIPETAFSGASLIRFRHAVPKGGSTNRQA